MEAVSSRDLSWQDALERVDGPQGQDRMDWCFAWLASWWVAERSDKTVRILYANLVRALRNYADDGEIKIIDDDPELSQKREAELVETIVALFPRKPQRE